ncbi:MAG TPA: class I SAM-dependent methyltransferase, partial [Vicinamibacterales bacterium]|nr:class I SAM-dependent methyltransferase [Vicinamibacterales bacterium]
GRAGITTVIALPASDPWGHGRHRKRRNNYFMEKLMTRRLAIYSAAFALVANAAFAQTTGQKPFEPQVGQAGKDVVWVPTPQAVVDKMLDMANVTKADTVMDLGSGDGRTVITAAKRGARGIGIEYNPDMVNLSKQNAAAAGVSDRATFIQADLFETDLSKADVITMFLLPSINIKLRPKILDLKPGTRIASNTFTMEDWQADETATVTDGCSSSWCTALFWIVPAKVAGTWNTPNGALTLTQNFQMLSGTLGNQAVQGRLRGNEITLTAGNQKWSGTVNGNSIQFTSPSAMTATKK